jgi:hypothetical protein
MSTRFKLPCDQCSHVHPISPTQAGETLSCDCGHSILVPTLREIRALEPLERPDAEHTSPDWNVQRGLLFVGGALLLAIAALATWRIWPQRDALVTTQPAFQEINFDVQRLNPNEAWDAWEHLRQQTLEFRVTPEYLSNRKKYRELSYLLYAAWSGAAIGLVMIGGSLLWPALPTRSSR